MQALSLSRPRLICLRSQVPRDVSDAIYGRVHDVENEWRGEIIYYLYCLVWPIHPIEFLLW